MPRARRRVVEGDSACLASMASRRAMRGRCAIGPTFTRASAGSGSSKETSSSNGAEDEREERPKAEEGARNAEGGLANATSGDESASERGSGSDGRRGMAWWIANVLQPLELVKLMGKGFLFYAAFSATALVLSSRTTVKSHPVPRRFDSFVESANRNDVRAVHIDGNQLTWAPRSKTTVSGTPDSSGTPFDRPIEVDVVYHTSRPKDAPMPYEALMKNRVDMSAPDPRNEPNFAPWIVSVSYTHLTLPTILLV